MSTTKIAITLEESLVKRIDRLVAADAYPSRSRAIQEAVKDKLSRLHRNRLARECTKLDAASEQTLAEEGMSTEIDQWPEY